MQEPTEVREPAAAQPAKVVEAVTIHEPTTSGPARPAPAVTRESVDAALHDLKAPPGLRAAVEAHLAQHGVPRSPREIAHRIAALQEEARAAVHPSTVETAHAGEHWTSAAGGRHAAPGDRLTNGERLLRGILDREYPQGLHNADRATVEARITQIADKVMSTPKEEFGDRQPSAAKELTRYVEQALGDGHGTVDARKVSAKVDELTAVHEPAATGAHPTGHPPATAPHEQAPRQPAAHDPAVHDPAGHDPTVHHPAVHDPSLHDPSLQDPGTTQPPVHGTEPVRVSEQYHTDLSEPHQVVVRENGQYYLVTEQVQKSWSTMEFRDVDLTATGGVDSPEAQHLTHRAAQDLADFEYNRKLDALQRWVDDPNFSARDAAALESGGMAAAVLTPDGKLTASTSVRTSLIETGRTRIEGSYRSRMTEAQRSDADHREATRLQTEGIKRLERGEQGIGNRKWFKDHEQSPHHWAVQETLDRVPTEFRSATHGTCAEPSVLDHVLNRVEQQFRDAWTGPGEAQPGNPAYREAFHEHLNQEGVLKDGQIASHRTWGEAVDHSEQLPCSTDDQVIAHFQLRNDYVDHVIDAAHIDAGRGIADFTGGDQLGTNSRLLNAAGSEHLVVVMHSEVVGGRVVVTMGGREVTSAEVARVLSRLVGEHPELQGRKVVLLTCEGDSPAMNLRGHTATTLARDVALRSGLDVAGADQKVHLSDRGRITVTDADPNIDPSARPDLPRAEASRWSTYSHQRDAAGEDVVVKATDQQVHDLVRQMSNHAPRPGEAEHWTQAHETAHPAAVGGHGQPDLSPHNEIWRDQPWQQEHRPPSLDELIPSSHAEIGRWDTAIRQAWAERVAGREFAGTRVELDLSDEHSITLEPDGVTVRLNLVHPELGRSHHAMVYQFHREADGSLYAHITHAQVPDRLQGHGFSSAFNAHMEAWYRYSGMEYVSVNAAGKVGGFAWARAGFDWMPGSEHRANAIFGRLDAEMKKVDIELDRVNRWERGDPSVDIEALRSKYGFAEPGQLRAEMLRQRDAAQEILDRAANHRFGSPGYPTPYEISAAGSSPRHIGKDAQWIGKTALLGSNWHGVKPISAEGTQHPRSAHPPAVEPEAQPVAHPTTTPGAEPHLSTVEHGTPASAPRVSEQSAALAGQERAQAAAELQHAEQYRSVAAQQRGQAEAQLAEAYRQAMQRDTQARTITDLTYRRDDALHEANWHEQNAARSQPASPAAAHERRLAEQARQRATGFEAARQRAELARQQAEQSRATASQQHRLLQEAARRAENDAAAHQRQAIEHEQRYQRQAEQIADEYAGAQRLPSARSAAQHFDQAARLQEQATSHELAARQQWERAQLHGDTARQLEDRAQEHRRLATDAAEQARLLDERARQERYTAEQLRTSRDPAYQGVAEHFDRAAQHTEQTAAHQRRVAADQARAAEQAHRESTVEREAEATARQAAQSAHDQAQQVRAATGQWHDAAAAWHEVARTDVQASHASAPDPATEHATAPQAVDASSRAVQVEPELTRAVEQAARFNGGFRLVEQPPAQPHLLRQQLAEQPHDALQYGVELPEQGYAEAAQRVIDGVANHGYEPVRLDGWRDNQPVVTWWRHPETGQEFAVRLETPASAQLRALTRDWYAARRAGAQPEVLDALDAQRQSILDTMRPPAGVDQVILRGHGPTGFGYAGPGEASHWAATHQNLDRLPLVHGPDAMRAVHDFVRHTSSGYDFSADPLAARHADALQAEPGVVKIAVVGRPNGELVVGNVRMSAADFARGLADLQHAGAIDLGANAVRMISCYAGLGTDPPAAVLARELGRPVTGATDLVWTDPVRGTETVASLDPRTGLPADPPDGLWRTFDANGNVVSVVPSTSAGHRLVLQTGADGLLHARDDPFGTYRSQDGLLHQPGDRAHTWRDVRTQHLHHEQDPPRTYRQDSSFRLVSEQSGRFVRDPLAAGRQPLAYRSAEGPREPYHPSQRPAEVS
ncbi:MAG: hypothetical protein J2P15_10160, partial [Micromonosporaceae bacterium]|nr:hypothetical protein [Micromonosporaceae bacterium]